MTPRPLFIRSLTAIAALFITPILVSSVMDKEAGTPRGEHHFAHHQRVYFADLHLRRWDARKTLRAQVHRALAAAEGVCLAPHHMARKFGVGEV